MKNLLISAAVFVGAMVALLSVKHFAASLDVVNPQDIKTGLTTVISASLAALVAAVRNILPNQKLSPSTTVVEQETPVQPSAGVDWQATAERYRETLNALRREARKIISDREQRLVSSVESNAVLKYALYCGLSMAFASCIATIFYPPVTDSVPRHHLYALLSAYGSVAFLFGFIASLRPTPPTRYLSLRIGGFASLYANACSVLISLVYLKDILRQPMSGTELPVIYGIVGARLIFLPLASVCACALGCFVGRAVASTANRPVA